MTTPAPHMHRWLPLDTIIEKAGLNGELVLEKEDASVPAWRIAEWLAAKADCPVDVADVTDWINLHTLKDQS